MTEQGLTAENLTQKLNAAKTALAALGSDRKEFLEDPVAPLLNQADEAAAILEVDPSRVRRLARQGLLGKSFTRTFVFHRSDVTRFAKLHRPPGNPKQRE